MRKKILIIGPSGIGKVYLRESFKLFEKIGIIGKKFDKKRNLGFSENKKDKIYNFKTFEECSKFNPDYTSICTPFYLHYDHIKKVKLFCRNILVEKPLIWFKQKIKNKFIDKKLEIIFKDPTLVVLVNLPFQQLAYQLLKKKIVKKKVKKFIFNYHTSGKQTFSNIAVDLLPHAISFILSLNDENEINLRVFHIVQTKFTWKCKIMINNCECRFYFKQNVSKKNNKMNFKLDANYFAREQKEINGDMKFWIIINKKTKILFENPMSLSLISSIKSFHKKKYVARNNNLAVIIGKTTYKLINYKKNIRIKKNY